MSIPSLNRGDATQSSQTQASGASPLRTPAPRGMGSVCETVSSEASTCFRAFFQPVMGFFAWIFQAIDDFFKPIFDFFSGKKETGTGTTTGAQHTGTTTGAQHSGAGVPVVFSSDIPPEVYQDLTVNRVKIRAVPRQFDPAVIRNLAEQANPPIQIDELLTQFDRICDLKGIGVDEVFYQDEGREITRAQARRSLENNYLGFVRQLLAGSAGYNRTIAADIELALTAIIFELRAPTDGRGEDVEMIGKKKTAIENLCSASEHCIPRRHTESFKVYRVLSNQAETMEEIVQQYIQETKEDLFLNYYSLSNQSGHVLNYIRRSVGAELGLNNNPINNDDPYINTGARTALSPNNRDVPHTEPHQFRTVFREIYTPRNILFNMKNFLNGRISSDPDFVREISQFIANEIQAHQDAGRLVPADTEDMPMPYQDDNYHLTDAGIKFLMVHFEHLNSATPNGHLVRAAVAT